MSTTSLFETSDWKDNLRKQASAQTLPVHEAERLFFEQSYIFIQNSAEPLMKPPHRVGFEIVYKNENLTRMAGIYIFRIGNTLLYAPVFYTNGTIKGADMLYRTDAKSITLLDPDWCEFLLQSYTAEEGRGISRSEKGKEQRGRLKLENILLPPGSMRKQASTAWEAMLQHAEETLTATDKVASSDASRLRSLIAELGPEALQALEKLASVSYEFDNAMYMHFEDASYVPDQFKTDKTASTEASGIKFLTAPAINPDVSNATREELERGYVVVDTRPHDKTAASDDPHVVRIPDEETLGTPEGAVLGKVVLKDGAHVEALVAPLKIKSRDGVATPGYASRGGFTEIPYRVVEVGGKRRVVNLYGEDNPPWVLESNTIGDDIFSKPKAGKAYVLFDKEAGMFLGSEFYVDRVEGKRIFGFTWARKGENGSLVASGADSSVVYKIRDDLECSDLEMGVIGKDCRFLEVSHAFDGDDVLRIGHDPEDNRKMELGSMHQIFQSFKELGFSKLAARRYSHDREKIALTINEDTLLVGPRGAHAALMTCLGLASEDALEVIKQASEKPCGYFVKTASYTRWNAAPEWLDEFDSGMGVAVDRPQSFEVDSESHYRERTPQRVGDVYKVREGSDIDSFGGPVGLDNYAKHVGMRQIFESGVIGSLLQEFDATSLVDQYLPDLEGGLDKLGRILFLVYWKPDDFGRMFGTDDVVTMESSVKGSFKSLGRLVLDLLQKTRNPKTSEVDA